MLIAVTGATGFIGTTLCTSLLEKGFLVRALVRQPSAAAGLISSGVEVTNGDLASSSSMEQLVSGADTVIHCAGAVRGSSQQQFDQINVEGTRALLQAILAQPSPPRLILLSSIVAREPQLSWYSASKYAGEQLLSDQADKLSWVILRPPAVYGPGDREMLPVFRAMARGFAPVPGDPAARVSLIHVRDLVAAIIACVETPSMPNTAYAIRDGAQAGYDWPELACGVEAVWQRRVRLVRIPALLLNGVAECNLLLSRILGYSPMLTPAKLRELRHRDWTADNSELQTAIDWQPRVDLQQGLTEIKESEL